MRALRFLAVGAGVASLFIGVIQPAAAAAPYVPAGACDDPAAIKGTSGDDVIVGTSGPDIICGRGGNDTIDGLGGDDILIGGPGNDTIYGRAGDDAIVGDQVFAAGALVSGGGTAMGCNGGDDFLYGGTDEDHITGDCRSDQRDINGRSGDDYIDAGGPSAGDDVVGDSRTYGAVPDGGNDEIQGSNGNDIILGDHSSSGGTVGLGGDDILHGGNGIDYGDADGGYDICRAIETEVGCEA